MDKTTVRHNFLKLRREIEKEDLREHSSAVLKKLLSMPCFINSTCVMIYMDFDREISTKEIADFCFKNGKAVYVPVCDTSSTNLIPSRIESIDFEGYENKYRILEPNNTILPDKKIDIVIVPGIAFDLAGNRVGYGKGYYDRFFNSIIDDNPIKIGICHDFQIVDKLPCAEHDICMDYVISEERIISL